LERWRHAADVPAVEMVAEPKSTTTRSLHPNYGYNAPDSGFDDTATDIATESASR
jgi:hypothetical protein